MGLEKELMSQEECPFCKIARKEMQAFIVGENQNAIAFLDLNPANFGHVLVTTKKHHEELEELSEEEMRDLFGLLREVVRKVKKLKVTVGDEEFEPYGVTVLLRLGKEADQAIKHIAFHVIPRTPTDNVYIAWRPVLNFAEILMNPQLVQLMEEIRKKLSEA